MAASLFLTVSKDDSLYPFNVLRNEETLHFGVRSIANQWHDLLQAKPNVVIHPRLLPTSPNVAAVMALEPGQAWTFQGQTVAQHGTGETAERNSPEPDLLLDAPSLFERAGEGLMEDLPRLKLAWRLRTLSEDEREAWASAGVVVHGPLDRIHLAPGATLRDASLNTEQGDILLGPDAEVMEGCRIRGPFALGEGSVLRMGALVYGATTIGSKCKVGGELSNVVMHDCSNKAHGGFLGNAVIGSCATSVPKPHAATSKTPTATLAGSIVKAGSKRAAGPLRPFDGRPQQNRHPHRVQHRQCRGCDVQRLWQRHPAQASAVLLVGIRRRGART